jgi:MoxR-like ATPase
MTEPNFLSSSELSATQREFQRLREFIGTRVIGQAHLVESMLVALLSDGHILVEGAPGLAKTRAINVLGKGIEADFHRIQFTPDLLPADLTGTEVYRPQDSSFRFESGPLFHNLVLADEINRSPAKVQSALLEAMAERQITVGRKTYPLPELFMVMATQNPIEQEGTYPLPEAQLDRFLLYIRIGYPDASDERQILELVRQEARQSSQESTSAPSSGALRQAELFAARREVLDLYMAGPLQEYILQLVLATRNSGAYSQDLPRWLQYGASPRATIALDRCSRARAWLRGRNYVIPEDIQALAPDILRHRLILSYEAEAEGVTVDRIIDELLRLIAVP